MRQYASDFTHNRGTNPFEKILMMNQILPHMNQPFQILDEYISRNYQSVKRNNNQSSIILMTVILGLVIFAMTFAVGDSCNFTDEIQDLEQQCESKYLILQCQKENNANFKQCSNVKKCLANPAAYMQELQQIQWQQFKNKIQDFVCLCKKNIIFLGIFLISFSILKLVTQKK